MAASTLTASPRVLIPLLILFGAALALACDEEDDPGSRLICCRTLRLDSVGPLAASEQKHIIGTYMKNNNNGEGWNNYRQIENFQKYLYFMEDYSRWFVGDAPGVNAVYAWCLDSAACPQDLNSSNWEYFAYRSGGGWIADPQITITCLE